MKEEQQTNKQTKTVKGPQSPWLFYHPHPPRRKSTRKSRGQGEPKAEADVGGGGGGSPVQCTLRVTESKKLLFARKGKWDSEEMGGKQKVKGGGVVMHKKRGWRAVHFSPTP